MSNKTQEIATAKEVSVFVKNKTLESGLIFSGVMAVFLFIATKREIDLSLAFIVCGLVALVLHNLYRLIHGKEYLNRLQEQVRYTFTGSIDELVLFLRKHGFELEKRIGGFYILRTEYKVFPNSVLMICKSKGGYFIQGKQVVMSMLAKSSNDLINEKNLKY